MFSCYRDSTVVIFYRVYRFHYDIMLAVYSLDRVGEEGTEAFVAHATRRTLLFPAVLSTLARSGSQ